MRKVLFINPMNGGMSDYMREKHNQEPAVIRYGILSLASYVKEKLKDGVEIKIVDYASGEFEGYGWKDYEDHLRCLIGSFRPDIIGISAMFNFLLDTIKELLRICRRSSSHALFFAGGPCAMAYAKELLTEKLVDTVSFYEGEIPVLRLCVSEDPKEETETGISWQTEKKVLEGFQPLPEMIVDLDEIPPLHFEMIDHLELYTSAADSIFNLEGEKYRTLPIHTSRGCPFNCIFCASHFVHGKQMRVMSAGRVISDVKRMVEKYQINHLEVCDDQFLLDRNRAKEILKGLADLHLEVSAESGVSIFAMDDEMSGLMKKAGMNTVSLALESGCQATLKNIIDKPVVLSNVNHIVDTLKENDIKVHASVVIGFPGETKEDRLESLEYLRKSRFDWINIMCATPLKGSRLYDLCVSKHYIEEDTPAKDGFHRSMINTEDFTAEEISEESYYMNLDLNFVHNYNLRAHNYQRAYDYFHYVLKKFPFHAIAHYCIAQAMEGLGYPREAWEEEMRQFREIIDRDSEWREYARRFGLAE